MPAYSGGKARVPGICPTLVYKLRGLRRGIRSLLFVELLAWAVIVCGSFFWLAYAVDRTFPLPVFIRVVLLLVGGAAAIIFLWWRWGRVLCRPLRDPELALILERAFPELGDLAVTAAEGIPELVDGTTHPLSYRKLLLLAAAEQADRMAANVRLRKVFRFTRPIRDTFWALLAAGLVASFVYWSADEATVWAARWIRFEDTPWPVRTGLVIKGFYRGEEVLLRGEEAELTVAVDRGMPLVPRVVKVRFREQSGASRESLMLGEGGRHIAGGPFRRFVFRLANVHETLEVAFWAGDRYVDDLYLRLKEPAVVASVQAQVEPPAYLERGPVTVPVPGVLHVPAGSQVKLFFELSEPVVRLEVNAAGNSAEYGSGLWKDLQEVGDLAEAIFDDFLSGRPTAELSQKLTKWQTVLRMLVDSCEDRLNELGKRRQAGSLTNRIAPGVLPVWAQRIRSAYRSAEELSQQTVSWQVYQQSPAWSVAEQWRRWLADWEETVALWSNEMAFSSCEHHIGVVLAPIKVSVIATDHFGRRAAKPTQMEIEPIPDRSPRVQVEPVRIGSAVTPQARLPLEGVVEDDYGLAAVAIQLELTSPNDSAVRSSAERRLAEPERPVTKLILSEQVDLSQFTPRVGMRCQLRVVAFDRCTLPGGPNQGESPLWTFDVISADELRLRLEKREILLRQQLEQVVTELSELRTQIRKLFGNPSAEGEKVPAADKSPQLTEGRSTSASGESPTSHTPSQGAESREETIARAIRRVLTLLEKSRNDVLAIHGGVLQIRDEIVNNRLEAASWTERLETRVIPPLAEAARRPLQDGLAALRKLEAALEVPAAVAGGAGKQVVLSEKDSGQWIAQVGDQIDEAISLLLAAQQAMLELEDFRRVVEMLREIVDAQAGLRDATREEHRRRLRELLDKPPGRP
ncbi:MAG: hypothetical protein RMJ16_00545 [Thermoguttaceae bacterium]|nr:hypothetical protein [Thermoguttaceae bacterium]